MRSLSFVFVALMLAFAVPAMAAPTASISGPAVLKKGEQGAYVITLSDAGRPPVLKEVHQSKMHLLVIDESMTDYQHIHPVAAATPGQYSFSFTPATMHSYTAWIDVTFMNDQHHYIPLALKGAEACAAPCVATTPSLSGEAGGLKGDLSFDGDPLTAGGMAMGDLTIADAEGKPVRDLEPVMGAFAHIVGFSADGKTVVHIHPMGDAPHNDQARGGPELMFHLEPEAAGVIKLFAQVKRGGRNIFIPFTLKVE